MTIQIHTATVASLDSDALATPAPPTSINGTIALQPTIKAMIANARSTADRGRCWASGVTRPNS
jgi:hypothetical protein